MWKKTALIVLYAAYGVGLTLVLLVVRFPKDTFLAYAAGLVEQELPGAECTIADVRYRYPYGLRFEAVAISVPAELFRILIPSASVTPDPVNLPHGYRVALELYNGTVESDVILDREAETVELPDLTVTGVRLEAIEALQQRIERSVSGEISLSGHLGWRRNDLLNATFTGNLALSAVQLPLKRPILQSEVIDFDEVRVVAAMQDGVVQLTEGAATGPTFTASFSGLVRPSRQWQESELEISGELDPRQHYLEQNRQVARAVTLLFKKYQTTTIPYTVSGSFREPAFQFGALQ